MRRPSAGCIIGAVVLVSLNACGGTSNKPAGAGTTTTVGASNTPTLPGEDTTAAATGTVEPCTVITLADVQAAIGGTVSLETATRKPTGCIYDTSGSTKYGAPGIIGGGVQLEWTPSWTPLAGVQNLGATPVAGVGAQAWFAAYAVHVNIRGGDLSILVTGVGTQQNRLQAMTDLAKAAVHHGP